MTTRTAILLTGLALMSAGCTTLPRGADGPDWYYPQWLAEAPHAPVFEVRDTVNKYGRYAAETKTITVKDLIRYHGHFCGGLVG